MLSVVEEVSGAFHVSGAAVVAFPVPGAVLLVGIDMEAVGRTLGAVGQGFAAQNGGNRDGDDEADFQIPHLVRTVLLRLRNYLWRTNRFIKKFPRD